MTSASSQLSSQQRLVAGMLEPANLLDIVRHYTLFTTLGGQTVKLVCRYQQFRAVTRAIERLKRGKTRREDGEHDRRGGIIWHTQGSGKSLTMVFLVRKLRTDPDLRRFKVVVVTDRKDLQKQLSETAGLTGESVEVAQQDQQGSRRLSDGPARDWCLPRSRSTASDATNAYPVKEEVLDWDRRDVAEDAPAKPPKVSKPFDVLNESEDILVMVDEAHRTQAGDLHANLLQALPNCARIGFTGTPIIMGDKKRTHDIFGEFIDRYTIKEAEHDGATVPILYEGRTATGAVKEGGSLDELFEDLFRERTPGGAGGDQGEVRHQGPDPGGAQADRGEGGATCCATTSRNILPNGYKAQVVAYSRRAAIRYPGAVRAGPQGAAGGGDGPEPGRQGHGRRGLDAAPAAGAGGRPGLAQPGAAGPVGVRRGDQ